MSSPMDRWRPGLSQVAQHRQTRFLVYRFRGRGQPAAALTGAGAEEAGGQARALGNRHLAHVISDEKENACFLIEESWFLRGVPKSDRAWLGPSLSCSQGCRRSLRCLGS